MTAAARSSARPRIGISTGFTDYGDYIGVAFSRPVVAVGAVPLLLPYAETAGEARELLAGLDGLVLAVGRDLEPHHYGAEPHPAMTPHSPLRHRSELALTPRSEQQRSFVSRGNERGRKYSPVIRQCAAKYVDFARSPWTLVD